MASLHSSRPLTKTAPHTYRIIITKHKKAVWQCTPVTLAASRRPTQRGHEFLGHVENLSQVEMHLRLLGLITSVIPSSLKRLKGQGEGRHPSIASWYTSAGTGESFHTNSCHAVLPQIINISVPHDPAVQLLGTDWTKPELGAKGTVGIQTLVAAQATSCAPILSPVPTAKTCSLSPLAP